MKKKEEEAMSKSMADGSWSREMSWLEEEAKRERRKMLCSFARRDWTVVLAEELVFP